jgi:glycosyltransferase involved in cell wall biosynthesis
MIPSILKKFENILSRYNNKNKNKNQVIRSLGCNGSEGQPRALLSYDLDCLNSNNIDFQYSTNRKENQVILTTLIDLGFIVDFFGCRNNYYCDGLRYDLVFGFGDAYRKSLLTQDGIRVLYLTEGPPDLSVINEKNRLDYFYRRHGKIKPIERSGVYYQNSDLQLANKIICLGELHKKHINKSPSILADTQSINPTGLPVNIKKNKFNISKNLLWFGSRGVIHKGLDLLIDTFKELPDWTLHVCGVDEKVVNDLMDTPGNIKFHGKISYLDYKFTELINLCNYSILLSCSEAVPTSVLTCMRAGLIPIVSENCGTEFPCAITCEEISIEYIKNIVSKTLELTENQIEEKSKNICSMADNMYSLPAFAISIKKAIVKSTNIISK